MKISDVLLKFFYSAFYLPFFAIPQFTVSPSLLLTSLLTLTVVLSFPRSSSLTTSPLSHHLLSSDLFVEGNLCHRRQMMFEQFVCQNTWTLNTSMTAFPIDCFYKVSHRGAHGIDALWGAQQVTLNSAFALRDSRIGEAGRSCQSLQPITGRNWNCNDSCGKTERKIKCVRIERIWRTVYEQNRLCSFFTSFQVWMQLSWTFKKCLIQGSWPLILHS